MKTNEEPEIRRLASRILADFDSRPFSAARPGFADRAMAAWEQERARSRMAVPPWWLLAGVALLAFLSLNLFLAVRPNPTASNALVAEWGEAYLTRGVASSQTLDLK